MDFEQVAVIRSEELCFGGLGGGDEHIVGGSRLSVGLILGFDSFDEAPTGKTLLPTTDCLSIKLQRFAKDAQIFLPISRDTTSWKRRSTSQEWMITRLALRGCRARNLPTNTLVSSTTSAELWLPSSFGASELSFFRMVPAPPRTHQL